MRVAIFGAGNGGHAMAAELSTAGNEVALCSRNDEKVASLKKAGGVYVHGVLGEDLVALVTVTSDPAEALHESELVVVSVPGMFQESYLEWILPLIDDQPVWLSPGSGGSLIAAQWFGPRRKSTPMLIETLTLPYAARLTGPARVGVSALINLRVAAFPSNKAEDAVHLLRTLFDSARPTSAISSAPNVLDTALNNINCIIHPQPAIMNMGWIESREERIFSLYAEGMTESVLKVLHAIDEERQAVVEAVGLPVFEIDEIYEMMGTGPIYRQSMGLGEKTERFYDRFITEDVPVGLVTLQSFGRTMGVPTPLIDGTISFSNILYDTDFVVAGRTVERLGLGGMEANEMQSYLQDAVLPSNRRMK